jgi:hypothetical protein
MRFLLVLLLAGCTTDEVRGWERRRGELELRDAELMQVTDSLDSLKARRERVAALRAELQLTELVREARLPARVFTEPGKQRVVVSGTVEACQSVAELLLRSRWLLPAWRLRLEGARCEYEAQTGEAFAALEQALLVSPPRWVPPPPSRLSGNFTALVSDVKDLERRVDELERALGDAASLPLLEGRLAAIEPKLAAARTAPPTCVAYVLERELALDPKDRGQVLELTNERLIHPLEPQNDPRLRGFVELVEGRPSWRCEEP